MPDGFGSGGNACNGAIIGVATKVSGVLVFGVVEKKAEKKVVVARKGVTLMRRFRLSRGGPLRGCIALPTASTLFC